MSNGQPASETFLVFLDFPKYISGAIEFFTGTCIDTISLEGNEVNLSLDEKLGVVLEKFEDIEFYSFLRNFGKIRFFHQKISYEIINGKLQKVEI